MKSPRLLKQLSAPACLPRRQPLRLRSNRRLLPAKPPPYCVLSLLQQEWLPSRHPPHRNNRIFSFFPPRNVYTSE